MKQFFLHSRFFRVKADKLSSFIFLHFGQIHSCSRGSKATLTSNGCSVKLHTLTTDRL